MKEDTKSKILFWVYIIVMVLFMIALCIFIYNELKAEELEILINQFPFWAVTISGDSTFQTVQVLKCYDIYPNGLREFLGYMVVVDSSGVRIYEEKPKYFLNWAIWQALRLQAELRAKGD